MSSLANAVYDNSSISSLKNEEQVRKRPAVIFGTNDVNGCAQAIFEIIANSIDEAREGHGTMIKLKVTEDNEVTVQDNGRGVPMDWNDGEGKFNWELVFCQMYASGKYDSSNYSASLGLNGLGATSTQYASEYMDVISVRDGKQYVMHFKKGKPVGELQITPDKTGLTGTTIRFKPDLEVFTDTNVAAQFYIDKIRRQAMLHPKVTFIIDYKDLNEIELYYEKGIQGFISEVCEHQMLPNPLMFIGTDRGHEDHANNEVYDLEMGLSVTFSRALYFVEMYHNGAYLKDADENVTDQAVRTAVTKAFEEYARAQSKISKSEKMNFKDIEEILVAIGYTSCSGSLTQFKNQTKTAILNPFIKVAYTKFVYDNLSRWIVENKAQADKVLNEIMANKDARESADAVKKKILKKLTASIDTFGALPEKFVECQSKSPLQREIYIVEGDSAAGSCKLARDAIFQAIMPVRGKILNCLKADLNHIFKSEIITDLLKIFGCGVEVKHKHIELPPFDINKLNWNKIIICTDADLDGQQIRCLIITMIYRLAPSLLMNNKVFIAETPLFEIEAKKETYFAYDENEKQQILNQLAGMGIKSSAIKVARSKGLGENEPEMMYRSTMCPATRRLVPVEYIENDDQLADLINALLGDDIESRRFLIDEYFDMDVDID